MDMVEVKVEVPVARRTEFYRWFADWLDGVTPSTDSEAATPAAIPEDPDTLAAAVRFWSSLRTKERGIWSLWVDAAPAMVTASEIVQKLNLNGARDIPGTLSWSTRKGNKAGFKATWRFRTDALTNEPIYGIEDVSYADILSQARGVAETKK